MGRAKAIWSLVCGILALLCWPIAIVAGPIALALGIGAVRRKQDGQGLAIAGIVTGSIGLLILVVIAVLAYAGVLSPAKFEGIGQPVIITDEGFILNAGNSRTTNALAAGTYEFEVTSTDGLTITTYASSKDFELAKANGRGAEAYSDCSATKSTRFHTTCTLPQGAVFTVTNPNLLQSINVDMKITKTR